MTKSDQVNELHSKSMEIAESAFVARIKGELEKVTEFSNKAFQYEREAAMLLLNHFNTQLETLDGS